MCITSGQSVVINGASQLSNTFLRYLMPRNTSLVESQEGEGSSITSIIFIAVAICGPIRMKIVWDGTSKNVKTLNQVGHIAKKREDVQYIRLPVSIEIEDLDQVSFQISINSILLEACRIRTIEASPYGLIVKEATAKLLNGFVELNAGKYFLYLDLKSGMDV